MKALTRPAPGYWHLDERIAKTAAKKPARLSSRYRPEGAERIVPPLTHYWS